jgi:hypothetical protein
MGRSVLKSDLGCFVILMGFFFMCFLSMHVIGSFVQEHRDVPLVRFGCGIVSFIVLIGATALPILAARGGRGGDHSGWEAGPGGGD